MVNILARVRARYGIEQIKRENEAHIFTAHSGVKGFVVMQWNVLCINRANATTSQDINTMSFDRDARV